MHRGVPVGRILFAGLLASGSFVTLAYGVAPLVLDQPLDLAGRLAALFRVRWETGMLIHFVDGGVLLPAIFAAWLYGRLPGAPWLRGTLFGTGLWLGSLLLLAPLGPADELAGGAATVLLWEGAGLLLYGLILGAVAGAGMRWEAGP